MSPQSLPECSKQADKLLKVPGQEIFPCFVPLKTWLWRAGASERHPGPDSLKTASVKSRTHGSPRCGEHEEGTFKSYLALGSSGWHAAGNWTRHTELINDVRESERRRGVLQMFLLGEPQQALGKKGVYCKRVARSVWLIRIWLMLVSVEHSC